jgi:hypothetical protein
MENLLNSDVAALFCVIISVAAASMLAAGIVKFINLITKIGMTKSSLNRGTI